MTVECQECGGEYKNVRMHISHNGGCGDCDTIEEYEDKYDGPYVSEDSHKRNPETIEDLAEEREEILQELREVEDKILIKVEQVLEQQEKISSLFGDDIVINEQQEPEMTRESDGEIDQIVEDIQEDVL